MHFWAKSFLSCFVQEVCFYFFIYLLILLSHCTLTFILLVFMKYGYYIKILHNVSSVRYLVKNSVAFVYPFAFQIYFKSVSGSESNICGNVVNSSVGQQRAELKSLLSSRGNCCVSQRGHQRLFLGF